MKRRSAMWREPILPSAVQGWPELAFRGTSPLWSAAEADDALVQIRLHRLFWPTPRSNTDRPLVADVTGPARSPKLRSGAQLASLDPSRLTRITAPSGHPANIWALLAGFSGTQEQALAILQQSLWRCPWRGAETDLASGLDALLFLHRTALENARPAATRGFTRWKRRAITPFLTGPSGPPRHLATCDPLPEGTIEIGWGSRPGATGWTAEDGFLRSVGLGVRDVLPASLVIARGRLHYDATGPNALDKLIAKAPVPLHLIARARRLRQRIIAAALTKYNQPATAQKLPTTGDQLAVLVPGQVESDASLLTGSPGIRTNRALLEAARARFPDAFLLYKPHPDVETGLRPGKIPSDVLDRLADGVSLDPSPLPGIAWCDRVVTMTSQLGFEALIRAKPVTTLGRPFYSGWGLTEDMNPPERPNRLTLDELVAAALILYPRYIDPISRLPAPIEIAIDGLESLNQSQNRPFARLKRLTRFVRSELLNAPEAPKWRPTR
ncbi:MAG: capsular biosynthesis protein [Pseudomonadota bacterium]